jgi:hypothetical protein
VGRLRAPSRLTGSQSYYLVIVAAGNNSIRTVRTERGECNAASPDRGKQRNANLYAHPHNREPLNSLDCAAQFGRATNSLLFTNVSTLEREFLTQRFTGQCFKTAPTV